MGINNNDDDDDDNSLMGGVYQGLGGAKPPHEPTEILKTTEILALYNFYIT